MNTGNAHPQNSCRAGAAGAQGTGEHPPTFPLPTRHSLPAPVSAHLSQPQPWHIPAAELKHCTGSPRAPETTSAQNPPASTTFVPTKHPACPRGAQAHIPEGISTICEPSQSYRRENGVGRATLSLPAQGAKPSPPSTATSTNPSTTPSKSPKALSKERNTRGEKGES